MRTLLCGIFVALGLALLAPAQALAADDGACPRPEAGSIATTPPDLHSKAGILRVHFNYMTSVDAAGRTLFCFVTDSGRQSPTLRVNPGDKIVMTVTNMVPAAPGAPSETVSNDQTVCGDPVMTITSVNVHFHGTNTAPRCHSDEVIHTLINSGETFRYEVRIPKDEPPGLYWYHPHVHGISSAAVTGGASGAIVVEGIANIQPIVAGLPERLLLVRDLATAVANPAIDSTSVAGPAPFWDLSLNYVPVSYPVDRPAIVKMHAGEKEFWRVANISANSILDLQLKYDGVLQPLKIVAFDGVPTGSQDGNEQGIVITEDHILLPPAGRAEFVVTAPSAKVRTAQFSTAAIDSGPVGDSLPFRPLADIVLTKGPTGLAREADASGRPHAQRFEGLAKVKPTARRKLYFSETFGHAERGRVKNPPGGERVNFFITVDGQKPVPFDPNNPPAITTTRGAVEDWTIENRTFEVHEFHMHQIHYMLLAVNGVPVPPKERQLYDTFQVPYWNGLGDYPSIKVRMDFRGPTVGDFVYHCHILQHEDAGMMAIIRVLPK